MEPSTDTTLREYLETTPPAFRSVLESNVLTELLTELAETHALSETTITELYNEIALVLLLVMPLTELQSSITNNYDFEPETAEALFSSLETKLFDQILIEGVSSTTILYGVAPELPEEDEDEELEEGEEETYENENMAEPIPITDVTPLRTMADDMQKVHGYGAVAAANEPEGTVHQNAQDELLKPQPVADMPTYNTTNDSESSR